MNKRKNHILEAENIHKLKKALLIQITLMTCVSCLYAESVQPPSDQKAVTLKIHDLSYAVSVDSVLYKIKQKRDVVFVDVRSPEEYAKIHISGSMNVPLYSIKTKPFLKTTPLILVNNGYNYDQLGKECEKLKESGFNVSILWGGLNAWKEKGLDFEGDVFEVKQLNRISPQEIYQERGYEGYLLIAVATELPQDSNQWFPDINHVKVLNEKTISAFKDPKNRTPFTLVLIFNKDGNGYDEYEKAVKKSGLTNVFYMSGGFIGYNRFLHDVARASSPEHNRVKTANKCSG